ncbi:MAG TPA: tRNA lysidine(34) synthetase TilS [Polyangiaceae bacterium]
MSSHPPTLITLATRALREECAVSERDRILVAVSGGPDSMALLDVLARLAKKFRFSLCAHGVDHGLRPEAPAELALAAAHARTLGVPFATTRVSVAAGGNLQARARGARYEALEAAARAGSATLLATAHHADDRAETVLLRLLRGAGPRGLAVLPARDGARIRPFLRARKSDILAHLSRHALPFAVDPSNADPRHQRARVRETLLPLLVELSPGIVGHLNALADALSTDEPPAELRDGAVRVALGRAQRLAVARASALGQKRARIWLSGGREARLVAGERTERGASARGHSKR